MTSQTLLRLGLGVAILTVVAVVSARSRTAAGILSTMPLNITIGLWIVYGLDSSHPQAAAPFARAMLLGLVGTMAFVAVAWLLLRRGWTLPWVIAAGYAAWAVVLTTVRPWMGP